jgi:hypothetical protein
MKSEAYAGFFVILCFSFVLLASPEGDRKRDETFVHHLKLLDRFGGLDVPLEQPFNNPVDITISKEGDIYVLDSNDNNIKVFESGGSFVKCIGR